MISTWNHGLDANKAGWEVLKNGGSSLDAVEAGARVTESDVKNRSVGIGGMPDREGHVTLDACIMDGDGNCGSVMCLEHIMHPISVARRVMEKTPHIVLVGEGALQFALSEGFEKRNLLTPESEKAWRDWLRESKYQPKMNIENESYRKNRETPMPGGKDNHDTIGILSLDAMGG